MAEDYTHKFNTELPPPREDEFRSWLDRQSNLSGRNMQNDLYDYDLRGYFSRYGATDLEGGHLTDQFKKPNHPTFSNESKYHGKDGHEGGEWGKNADGKFTFKPGRTNLELQGQEELKDYFRRIEPDVELQMPETAQ